MDTNSEKCFSLQPVSVIPLCRDISKDLKESSQQVLESFLEAQHKPYVLTDEIIDRSLILCMEQNEDIPDFLYQCAVWRKGSLTREQCEAVDEIEENYRCLEKNNEEILSLISCIGDQTIDKILEKDDALLACDFLLGKLKF